VRLSERVRQAREQVDLLIVSAHWGPNWGDGPPPEQAPFAHALIDAGADLIFGHSGHVVRGVELYRERPILYCAGDFIDDYMVDPVERNDESCIFVPQMLPTSQQRLLGLRLYPTMIDNCQARLADGEQAERIARKVGQLCAERQTPLPWQPTGRYLECELGAADRASTGVTAGTSGPHSAASSVGFVEFLVGGS
jgi:poly-gamma-glutamate synthesis protein (capsule biosynthesis protein)